MTFLLDDDSPPEYHSLGVIAEARTETPPLDYDAVVGMDSRKAESAYYRTSQHRGTLICMYN